MELILTEEEIALNNTVLFDHDYIERMETTSQDNIIQSNKTVADEEDLTTVRNKRPREIDEQEDWITVKRNGKRTGQKVDLYINSSEKLPKQFALAKILKTNNISHITRVKYVSPYKVFIQCENTDSAEELMNCKQLQDLGWRCQKPLEVAVSYGVIKNVELDLSENEMIEAISSDRELIGVKRLKRREKYSSVWENSESVRLCFKGSSLPSWVYIYGMKINVDPYVFPVTQCSRCWRFGHFLRVCPRTKIVCPKCGKDHANCETTTYKCVNCTGNHLSLDRSCPVFKKEKYLRKIMADYNCSYRKALEMYATIEPPFINTEPQSTDFPTLSNQKPELQDASHIKDINSTSYASMTQKTPRRDNSVEIPQLVQSNSQTNSIPTQEELQKKKKNKKKKHRRQELNWNEISKSDIDAITDTESEPSHQPETKERKQQDKSNINFTELISKLYVVFCNSQINLKDKIIQGLSLFFEWLVSTMKLYIWNLPFKSMFVT